MVTGIVRIVVSRLAYKVFNGRMKEGTGVGRRRKMQV
jgi:hypothetical protein